MGAEETKPVPRAPLFLAALCFGIGCALGGAFPFPLWLPAIGMGAAWALWAFLPSPRATLGFFYFFCFCAAAFHARLPLVSLPPHDLRALPAAKFANPVWEGTISDIAEFNPSTRNPEIGHARFTVAMERWKALDTWDRAEGKAEVDIAGASNTWQYGQRVQLTAPLEPIPGPDAPGRFDAQTFQAHRGIYYQLRLANEDAVQLSPTPTPVAHFVEWAARARASGIERLRLGLESDPLASQVLAGIVLGQRKEVPLPELFLFRNAGAYHLFSANGGDLAVVLGIALAALRLCGLIRWRWGWIVAPALFFYALVSGSQPSVLRGLTAASIVLAAWSIGRPIRPLNLWALTLFAVLSFDPQAALDLGFQFSFLVVLSLIVFASRFAHVFRKPLALDPFIPIRLATPTQKFFDHVNTFATGMLATCVAAWIASVGLEVFYFHQLCLTAIPANFIGIPLAGLIFTIGVFSLLSSLFCPVLPILLNNANWVFVKILLFAITFLGHLPCASVYLPIGAGSDRTPQFTVAEAGYGTSTLIRYAGHAWLLNPSDEKTYFREVDPVRKYLGVNRFDGLFLTQWTSGEAGAAPVLPDLVTGWMGPLFAPPFGNHHGGLWAARLETEHPPRPLAAGDSLTLGPDFTVTVLSPNRDQLARLSGDRALVLLFTYKNSHILYAGHVSFGIEMEILKAYPDLKTDVLIEGHHPLEVNLSADWLKQLTPHDLVLIGHDTPGMLHEDPLLALSDPKPIPWTPAESGATCLEMNSDSVIVKSWKNR